MLRKALRRAPGVLVVLCVIAGGAYAVKVLLLDGDDTVASAPLRAQVLAPGTFESAHPYAPYYVVPRSRFRDPSQLSPVARNNLMTKPESALTKGALAGSPQIVRLALRNAGEGALTVEAVRAKVVSDGRPLRGWYTALPGCMVKPVERALVNLDARRATVRYAGADGARSRALRLKVEPDAPQVIELQARTARHRIAWTAELSVRDADGRTSTVVVDDGGKPFRVTSTRRSRGYEPRYGAAGITSFQRSRSLLRGGSEC